MTDRGRELGGSAVFLALALLAGAAIGRGWIGLSLGLAVLAGRHLYLLSGLADMMTRGGSVRKPLPGGLWRTVYASAGRLRSRSRKRKRRLARFLARFRDAAAALPDAAIVIDSRGRIGWLNPAADRLLGLVSPVDVGAKLVDRIRDPGLVTYLDDADRGRSIELRSPVDGSKILSLRAVPFGKKRERLVLARDVTRTRLADDAAEDFVASVSHELRTPLTVISGFLEELSQSTGDDEEIARALELTREQTTRMNTIVQDLLEFSRLQMDTPAAGRAPVPVPAILERAAEEARALSAGRGHLVELEIDPELEIDGNEELLRSAFTNLVVNAVHHTPPRTTIAIRWWRDAAGAHLGVRDNGEGIAARHIPRLTERFYRVDPSRSRRTGGTGLGLAIVKHALERHGAELQIESAAGTGSSFTCHFPDQVVIAPERVPDS